MTHPASEQSPESVALTPETTAALLARALRARQSGDLPAARSLLRALAVHQPALPQIWLALATVAETRAEQRLAFQRALALDPANALARRSLSQMDRLVAAPPLDSKPAPPAAAQASPPQAAPASAAPAAASPPPAAAARAAAVGSAPALTPAAPTPEERARAIRWPLYLVLGVAALVLLLAIWWMRQPAGAPDLPATAPTAALPGAVLPTGPAGVPTSASAAEPPANAATEPSSPVPPTPLPTLAPTAVPTLALGQVVQSGAWHVVLLRPNDTLPLEGAIGALQPRGRFFLALVAIGNDGAAPARMPADLVALVDAAGQRYAPDPALSTAYLAAYERGLRGDLSMEDAIPADGGNKSIPLIFDIPPGARGLMLMVQGAPYGWPVGP